MFRNDQQRAAVCDTLTAWIRGPGHFWTAAGELPTEAAVQVLEGHDPLSGGERRMVLFAWALWNGSGDLLVADILNVLDRPRLKLLGGLFAAMCGGPVALDRWCDENGQDDDDVTWQLTTKGRAERAAKVRA